MSASPAPLNLLKARIGPGITLVEASAGTGKTHCLTQLVLRLLLERRVEDITRLLVVTFTNAAADELVTRVRAALHEAIGVLEGRPSEDPFLRALAKTHGPAGAAVLRAALRRFDEVAICTIHSFCKRVLERAAFESGEAFNAEFLEDETALLEQAKMDFWRRNVYTNRLLAELSVGRKWNQTDLLALYRAWRRYPEAALVPADAPPLAEAVRTAERALSAVRAAWRRDPEELAGKLNGITWNKEGAFAEVRRAQSRQRLDAFCEGDILAGLDVVQACTSAQLTEDRNKKRKNNPAVPDHPFIAACDALEAAVDALDTSWRKAFLEAVRENFEQAKARRHALTFDDLLCRVHEALRRFPALADSLHDDYQAALIDEFQDTDPVQYRIFATAFARRPLVFVGDPKQAIYAFRGADVFAYLAAKADAAQEFTLRENWRSERGMVEAVNALFSRAHRPFVLPEIAFHTITAAGRADAKRLDDRSAGSRAALQWWFVPGAGAKGMVSKETAETRILERLAREIVHLLRDDLHIGERRVTPRDIAVLVRTHQQATAVQERLRLAGVPAVVGNTGSILQSREMAELERVLAAIAGPQDAGAVRAAVATEMWGLDAGDLFRLNAADADWQTLVDELNGWREEWLAGGFMRMMESLLTRRGVRRRLLACEDGERRMTNLLHAVTVVHQAIETEHLSPEGVFKWLAAARRRAGAAGLTGDQDPYELHLERDAEAVQIVTIHKSKGLQYGIVFCPFLCDGRRETDAQKEPLLVHTPGGLTLDYRAGGERTALWEQYEVERLAESVRMVYVALTRAIHRAYVAWGQIGIGAPAAARSGLGYLLHQPAPDEAASPVEWTQRVRAHLAENAGDWQPELQAFAEGHGEIMEMELLDDEARAREKWTPPASAAAPLEARTYPPEAHERLVGWEMVSYSSLSRERGRKRVERPDHEDAPATPVEGEEKPAGIFGFGRGPRARRRAAEIGVCLHGILQRWSFAAGRTPETEALVRAQLAEYGLAEPEAHAKGVDPVETVLDLLARLARTPLPGADFALAEVPRDRRAEEWSFYVPLEALRPRDLAALFARPEAGARANAYAPRLRALGAEPLRGYLNGFIDLLFEHGGRWYVIDWKFNHLGDRPDRYAPEALWPAMVERHYPLQYHLYSAAVDRYLRARLKGYDYERHFGGVWYVFLRGLDGGGRNGLYHDRPPRALIAALNAAIERRDPA